MTALDLVVRKREELEQRIRQMEADVFAMQGAIQVLTELEKELRDENPILE